MLIAVSAETNQGLDSQVAHHFGRCPFFAMVEVEGEEENVPLVITAEDGTVDEEAQKVAFEFINSQPGIKEKIILAGAGLSVKNS